MAGSDSHPIPPSCFRSDSTPARRRLYHRRMSYSPGRTIRPDRRSPPNRAVKIIAGLVAICLITSVASSAWADWQYTKWGMTPEQVQRAAGGVLSDRPEPCALCDPKPLLAGTYSTGDFTFPLVFYFDQSRKLASVGLSLPETRKCHALHDSLKAKYGTPNWEKGHPPIEYHTQWLDAHGGNTVTFHDSVSGACYISYAPLASGKGL